MDDERREFDRIWREAWDLKLKRLLETQHTLRKEVRQLNADVEELRDLLRGGIGGEEAPVLVRVNETEIELKKLEAILNALRQQLDETRLANEQGKTQRRGQTFALAAAVIAALFANWDKISPLLGIKKDPVDYADRIQKDIEDLKKTRGPEIQKKLKEIEKAARRR